MDKAIVVSDREDSSEAAANSVTVSGSGEWVFAVYVDAENGGTASASVANDVAVHALKGESEKGSAAGAELYASGSGSTAAAAVNGNVNVEAEAGGACAVRETAIDGGKASCVVDGDLKAVSQGQACVNGVSVQAVGAQAAIAVDGAITAKGEHGYGIEAAVSAADGNAASAVVTVLGDVSGADSAVMIRLSEASDPEEADASLVNVTVAGTLHAEAEEGAAVLIDDGIRPDNVKLTVWACELNKDGCVVEQGNFNDENQLAGAASTEVSREIEKNIQYIIRVEQPVNGAALKAVDKDGNALAKSGDYDVAREGDAVFLKIEVQDGYRVVGAFNGMGNKFALLRDAKGDYYVEVPRGGAVYLSAQVEKKAEEASPPQGPAQAQTEAIGTPIALQKMESQYVLILSAAQSSMIFLRSTLEHFAKTSDKMVIKTGKGSYTLSISELLRFNEKAVNFRFVLTDEALEIYVSGELFRSVGFDEMV